MNLLNPENGLGTEILSHSGPSNAEKFDEDVISIADDYEPESDGDIFQAPPWKIQAFRNSNLFMD